MITGDIPNVGTGETRNLLYRAVPEGIDISIVTHLAADLTENFEAVGMALLGDDARILFHAGFCQHCLREGEGIGIWVEAYQGDRFALYAYDGIGPFPNEVNVEGWFDWFELTTYP